MPRPSPHAILLVDGYNVIGALPYLQRARDFEGLEASRLKLIEALVNYSAFEGLDTRIVFDAYYQDTPGYSEDVMAGYLCVCYTDFGQTADTYIEKFCASFSRDLYRGRQRLIVATSDRAQQQTVIGYGAESMSALQLGSAIETSAYRVKSQHRGNKKPNSRFLFNSLDAQAQQRLVEWRKTLG